MQILLNYIQLLNWKNNQKWPTLQTCLITFLKGENVLLIGDISYLINFDDYETVHELIIIVFNIVHVPMHDRQHCDSPTYTL